MASKPIALQIADALVTPADCNCFAHASFECGCDAIWPDMYLHDAAAELRWLHEENERLRDAVAAEREACAKLAGPHLDGAIAAAIRARNNQHA